MFRRFSFTLCAFLLPESGHEWCSLVNGWYRKQARALGIQESPGGSVTIAQRFGSALNLNPHFHSLLLEVAFKQRLSDEEYSFKLKTPWSDGTTHLVLSPMELIEKLAILVPKAQTKPCAMSWRTCSSCKTLSCCSAKKTSRERIGENPEQMLFLRA